MSDPLPVLVAVLPVPRSSRVVAAGLRRYVFRQPPTADDLRFRYAASPPSFDWRDRGEWLRIVVEPADETASTLVVSRLDDVPDEQAHVRAEAIPYLYAFGAWLEADVPQTEDGP